MAKTQKTGHAKADDVLAKFQQQEGAGEGAANYYPPVCFQKPRSRPAPPYKPGLHAEEGKLAVVE